RLLRRGVALALPGGDRLAGGAVLGPLLEDARLVVVLAELVRQGEARRRLVGLPRVHVPADPLLRPRAPTLVRAHRAPAPPPSRAAAPPPAVTNSDTSGLRSSAPWLTSSATSRPPTRTVTVGCFCGATAQTAW